MPGVIEVAPHARFDGHRTPVPTGLGVLTTGYSSSQPIALCRIAVGGCADQQPGLSMKAPQRDIELGLQPELRSTRQGLRPIIEVASRALPTHFVHPSPV